ncbi:small basic protein [San Miguel sea lion virus 8]|uniref:small basic protein n=1 Tax=San Miguel sea lion virus 8 TaxID=1564182 RepID=UPI00052AC649|nr:small basic protein [San Miguel sea lion virus 8]AIU47327.1 small basic protein [San Miguel sea lion virus 8]AKG26795.1 ORF-3 protein [San Miguel sea lion virus 8]
MSASAIIGAASGAVSAGSNLIGSIADAIYAGQRLDLQKTATAATIELNGKNYELNLDRFNLQSETAKSYLKLAQDQQKFLQDYSIRGPALQAQAMVDAGFRNNLYSNGRQLTFGELQTAMNSAADRFYHPTFTPTN